MFGEFLYNVMFGFGGEIFHGVMFCGKRLEECAMGIAGGALSLLYYYKQPTAFWRKIFQVLIFHWGNIWGMSGELCTV